MDGNNKKSRKIPCNVCGKNVRGNAKSVCCDICDNWVHIKCNGISASKYDELCLEDNDESFFCIRCFNNELPFGLEFNTEYKQSTTLGLENSNLEDLDVNISKKDKKLMNLLKKVISENNDPNIKNSSCRYYSIDEFCSKEFQAKQLFSIFHLNIASLQFHKNDLDILLDKLKLKFDIIAISESKLIKGVEPLHDITLPNYHIEHTPTEASKGGTLLYISNKLNYKIRKDLEIYESKKIESTFIEIINTTGKKRYHRLHLQTPYN